jgi:hypothetical protein
MRGKRVKMHPLRLEFASTLTNGIAKICLENLEDNSGNPHNDPIQTMFGISKIQAMEVCNKLVNALPDNFFKQRLYLKENIQYIIATEFFLFQAREDYNDKEYGNNLANFIYEISGYISQRYQF